MYADEHVDAYDLIYAGRGKDYAAEAAQVLSLVRARAGPVESILDVACGTGAHLRHFADAVRRADGLEISPRMISQARRQVSAAELHQGDMRDFELGRTYTAVVCMFSSIGHMRDIGELGAALRAFARHTASGGLVVVEPWWFPETFIDGYVASDAVRDDERVVTRVSHSVRRGAVAHMEVHLLIAEYGAGVRHSVETHEMSIFRREEYEEAFAAAGLGAEFVDGPSGRGLFLGLRH